MKINSKSKKIFLFILSIIAIIIISSILAYLTDKDTRENEFTIGNVNILLTEPTWDSLPDINENDIPDIAETLGPGESVPKDPTVENIGENPAYVYLRVTVPKALVMIDDDEEPINQEIFTYNWAETDTYNLNNWQQMEDLTLKVENNEKLNGADTVTYTYYYKNNTQDYLKPGEKTDALFDRVTLKNITNFNGIDLTYQIVVQAYAIQLGEELTVDANPLIERFKNEKLSQGSVKVHYLSGFDNSEVVEEIDIEDSKSIELTSIMFENENKKFLGWQKITNEKIETEDVSEDTDTFEKIEEGYNGVANKLSEVLGEDWQTDIIEIIEENNEENIESLSIMSRATEDNTETETKQEKIINQIESYLVESEEIENEINNIIEEKHINEGSIRGLSEWFITNKNYIERLQEYEKKKDIYEERLPSEDELNEEEIVYYMVLR